MLGLFLADARRPRPRRRRSAIAARARSSSGASGRSRSRSTSPSSRSATCARGRSSSAPSLGLGDAVRPGRLGGRARRRGACRGRRRRARDASRSRSPRGRATLRELAADRRARPRRAASRAPASRWPRSSCSRSTRRRSRLLVVPAAALRASRFRAYGAERRRHEHVEVPLPLDARDAERARAPGRGARAARPPRGRCSPPSSPRSSCFDADAAGGVLRSAIGPGGEELARVRRARRREELARGRERARGRARGAAAARPRAARARRATSRAHGLDDAIFTVLRRRRAGLRAAPRRRAAPATSTTFTEDDRALFETFASHAAVLLENDRVKEQLRYQAFHDALTGLPNRALFARAGRRRARARPPARTHRRPCSSSTSTTSRRSTTASATRAGDELLVAVAEPRALRRPRRRRRGAARRRRVRRPARERRPRRGRGGRRAAASRRCAAPFVLHGRELLIHASIGIATGDGRAGSPTTCSRTPTSRCTARRAAASGSTPSTTRGCTRACGGATSSPRALEQAVDRDEIKVYYQPIVGLANGARRRRRGARPLAPPEPRARPPGQLHPARRGDRPDDARSAGACSARPAGRRASGRRRSAGAPRLTISVNLSPLELQNPHLVDEVARHARRRPGSRRSR